MPAPHVIESLELDVAFRSEADAWAQHGRFGDLVVERAPGIIDEVLDEFSDGEIIRRLDRLEVDLGSAPPDEPDDQFEARLRAALRRALADLGAPDTSVKTSAPAGLATAAEADAERLWRLTQQGRLPWHAAALDGADVGGLVGRVLDRDGAALAQALRADPGMPRLLARIAQTWSAEHLQRLWSLLAADSRAVAAFPAPPPLGSEADARTWRDALVAVAAGAETDPAALALDLARKELRAGLPEGRIPSGTWRVLLRDDPGFVREALQDPGLPDAALERLPQTLGSGQWRELLALFAMPADAEMLALLAEEAWAWRLDDAQSVAATRQALRGALLAHARGDGRQGVTAAGAIAALVRTAAALGDQAVPVAAATLAAQWPGQGLLAAARPRVLPVFNDLAPDAAQADSIAAAPAAPASSAEPSRPSFNDPAWDRLAQALETGVLEDAAWTLLYAEASDWLRLRLRTLGRRADWRAAFAGGLTLPRFTQLLGLWLAPPEASWLAALSWRAASAVERVPPDGEPGPVRWLLDETLLSLSASPTPAALAEAWARRQAQAQGLTLAAAAQSLAALVTAGRPPPSQAAAAALARLFELAGATSRSGGIERDTSAGPGAEPVEPAGAADGPKADGAEAAWRHALAHRLPPDRLVALLALWLGPDDAHLVAAFAALAVPGAPYATAPGGVEPSSAPTTMRTWVLDEIRLAEPPTALTAAEVVRGVVQRAAHLAGEAPERTARRWVAALAGQGRLGPAVHALLADRVSEITSVLEPGADRPGDALNVAAQATGADFAASAPDVTGAPPASGAGDRDQAEAVTPGRLRGDDGGSSPPTAPGGGRETGVAEPGAAIAAGSSAAGVVPTASLVSLREADSAEPRPTAAEPGAHAASASSPPGDRAPVVEPGRSESPDGQGDAARADVSLDRVSFPEPLQDPAEAPGLECDRRSEGDPTRPAPYEDGVEPLGPGPDRGLVGETRAAEAGAASQPGPGRDDAAPGQAGLPERPLADAPGDARPPPVPAPAPNSPAALADWLARQPELLRSEVLRRLWSLDVAPAVALLDRLEAAWRRMQAAGAAPRAPRGERPWRFLIRELVEEDRVFEDGGFAARWFADVVAGVAPQSVRRWREALIAELGPPVVLEAIADAPPDDAGASMASAPSADTRWPWLSSPAPEPGEAIYVGNAGLVLAGPFIATLFERLGLVRDGAFVDDASAWRGVDILQLIVDGGDPAPEHQLVLNKLLCGLDLTAPLERGDEITPDERAMVEGLLQAMIEQWRILGSTSAAGLRETFLRRQGVLRDEIETWSLVVEPGPFDMLIDQVPWGFRTLKLPWMAQVLHVDWR